MSTAIPIKAFRYIRSNASDNLTDANLAQVITDNPSAVQLYLVSCTALTDSGLQLLHTIPLEILDLSGCGQFSVSAVQEMLQKLSTTMRTLILRRCEFVTEELILSFLRESTSIETIDISFCPQIQLASLVRHLASFTNRTSPVTIISLKREEYESVNNECFELHPHLLQEIESISSLGYVIVQNSIVLPTTLGENVPASFANSV